jgi:hypothetical protein
MQSRLVIVALVVAGGIAVHAQDPLSAAKDLYASAAYEDALSTLSHIDAGASAPDVARQADEYRAFCLFALGRTREAESLAELMIRKRPLARLEAVDASPRLETMFTDVRRRLLPSLIREQFRSARTAIDRKDFAAAEPQLKDARLMIDEADRLGIKDDSLADLGVLVDGFLGLIQSAADARSAPQNAPAVQTANGGGPGDAAPRATSAPAPGGPARGPQNAEPSSPAPEKALDMTRPYTIADEGVKPPVTIDQRMPAMPMQLLSIVRAAHARGMLDVLIDEAGRVADVTLRQPLNPAFDPLLMRTARDWKYQPATKDGVPVRFVKTIVLVP